MHVKPSSNLTSGTLFCVATVLNILFISILCANTNTPPANSPINSVNDKAGATPLGVEFQEPAGINSNSYNSDVLLAVSQMPKGGDYSVTKAAYDKLRDAIKSETVLDSTVLDVTPAMAKPSFCSGATYLVFLKTIENLIHLKKLTLSQKSIQALMVRGQADGEGVWGRWNANGPGTARLFYELGLGTNFSSISLAQPGDFMKIFWNDEIGSKESGHSVIFLGLNKTSDGDYVRFWSSNLGMGFGEKQVLITKVKRMLFSRLELPSALDKITSLPKKDAYLSSMLTTTSTVEQMFSVLGIESFKGPVASKTSEFQNANAAHPFPRALPLQDASHSSTSNEK